MLSIWFLVPLLFLNPACTSGSSWFTYCWSLTWRILSITLLACEMDAHSLNILWHCPSLELKWKLIFSSPVSTAEFSKLAGILSTALSQHYLLEFEIVQLEFHRISDVFHLFTNIAQGNTLQLVIMTPYASLGCDSMSDFTCFNVKDLDILRSPAQVYYRMFFNWSF